MLSTLLGLQSLLGAIRENYMAREIFEYWIKWWIFLNHQTHVSDQGRALIPLSDHFRAVSAYSIRIISIDNSLGCCFFIFSFPLRTFLIPLFVTSIAFAILWHVCPQEIWKHWYSAVLPGFKTTSGTGSTMSCCRPAAWRGWTGRTGPPLPRLRLLRSSTLLKYE